MAFRRTGRLVEIKDLSHPNHIVPKARTPNNLIQKMLAAQNRERKQLLVEMVKMRGLMPLLMKPRNGQRWTVSERTVLREKIRALARVSPYAMVLVLPGSFIALPILAWWLDRRQQIREA
jgi:hypothetical protein